MAAAVTYSRLRSGHWGIRSLVLVKHGDQVVVSLKSGKWRMECVDRVVWTDGSTWLATIQQNTDQRLCKTRNRNPARAS